MKSFGKGCLFNIVCRLFLFYLLFVVAVSCCLLLLLLWCWLLFVVVVVVVGGGVVHSETKNAFQISFQFFVVSCFVSGSVFAFELFAFSLYYPH